MKLKSGGFLRRLGSVIFYSGPPRQFCLAQDVPRTPEDLRLHRNTLTMELVWLQQAIDSRKKVIIQTQCLCFASIQQSPPTLQTKGILENAWLLTYNM